MFRIMKLFLKVQIVWYIFCSLLAYWIRNFNNFIDDCDHKIEETLIQICTNYKRQIFDDNLCEKICTNQIDIIDCPKTIHISKFVVIFARNNSSSIVIKSKYLIDFENENDGQNYDCYQNIKNDLFDDYFNISSIQHVFNDDGCFLINQNEYFLSKFLENDRIFPPILDKCGHFYVVPKLENIMETSMILPLYPLKKRIKIAIDLIKFLHRFTNVKLIDEMEMCDIKYYHFGYHGEYLLLLDSDSVYNKKSLKKLIEQQKNCIENDDCHLFDCHGKCSPQGICHMDMDDNNLKRICRNILFMGQWFQSLLQIGLLSTIPFAMTKHQQIYLEKLYHLCFDADHQNLNYVIDEMEKILLTLVDIS